MTPQAPPPEEQMPGWAIRLEANIETPGDAGNARDGGYRDRHGEKGMDHPALAIRVGKAVGCREEDIEAHGLYPEVKPELEKLRTEGRPVQVRVFPDADHGIIRFVQQEDGERRFIEAMVHSRLNQGVDFAKSIPPLEVLGEDYPGERLVACRNPELAKLRTHKREELLAATEASLEKIKARVEALKLVGRDEIGLRVGKVVNQYKVAKHFELTIGDNAFTYARRRDAIAAEAALDGIYIIRTSVPSTQMDSADCVRNYKALAKVERAFRSLKTIDLKVRPIHHRTADRVRAHIFLCMLAYYVEWHMREAWRELMFADTDQQAKATRDPVAPARRSKIAMFKVARHALDDGTPAHSFATLMAELATIVRNTCRTPNAGADAPTFEVLTTPNPHQQRALDFIQQIRL